VIWTSPLISSDPLVWRKDLPADLKAKIVTFVLNYGRVGTPDEIEKAKAVLHAQQRAPYNPSSDRQLLPVRKLEANKELMKVNADDKFSQAERASKVAALKAKIAEIEKMEKALESDPYQQRVAAFIAADKANDQKTVEKVIGEFAAGFAGMN